MDQLEKVDKLRERANVSYEEAKEALEASNWDLLDAMVYLEKHGKQSLLNRKPHPLPPRKLPSMYRLRKR